MTIGDLVRSRPVPVLYGLMFISLIALLPLPPLLQNQDLEPREAAPKPRNRPAHSCDQHDLRVWKAPILAIQFWPALDHHEIRAPLSSSLERDFCRRRLARQKGPEDDVSAQRPEIGDHHSQEMAAEMAFLLASYQLRVSEDWVVGAPGLEPGTR